MRCMTEPPRCYAVTITVDRDDSHHPNLAEFAVAAEQAASARTASIVSAHTAGQIISVVTVQAEEQPAAVAVVSEALRRPVPSPTRCLGATSQPEAATADHTSTARTSGISSGTCDHAAELGF